MNLIDYYGRKVEILAKDGKLYKGVAAYYFEPEENENNKESIAVTKLYSRNPPFWEFYEYDIVSIKVVD